jgi:signal transduction histidine kinase
MNRPDAQQRTRLLSPTKTWLAFVTLAFLLLLAAFWRLYEASERNNLELIQRRVDTLIRAGLPALELGDYRSFTETIGSDFSDLWIRLEGSHEAFESGQRVHPAHCASQQVAVGAESMSVTVCQRFFFPRREIVALFFAFVLAALASFLLVHSLERIALQSLVRSLNDSGIEAQSSNGFFGVLHRLRSMAGELAERRRREIETAKLTAVGEMATQVAHDIRSPMAALRHVIDQTKFADPRMAKLARNAFDRMDQIAESLLDHERLDSYDPEPVKLQLALEEALSEKKVPIASGFSPSITLEIPASLGEVSVWVPSGLFRRVLSNILNNSLEAAGAKAAIHVAVAEVDNDWISLSVSDNGPGFASLVLERFGQRGLTLGKVGGSGLGLSHALKSVERWGGKLHLESPAGGGARVTMTVPRIPESPSNLSDLDAILIDDDPLIRDSWRLSAETSGKRIAVFSSVSDFVASEHGKSFDTKVYVDFRLGDDNGLEAAQKLHLLGFREISLTTGYRPTHIEKPAWLKEIIGKTAPWRA